jgi:hypothetical protein
MNCRKCEHTVYKRAECVIEPACVGEIGQSWSPDAHSDAGGMEAADVVRATDAVRCMVTRGGAAR